MKNSEAFSDDQLNALLDNELDDKEREKLSDVMREDKELSARYCELRQIKDMVSLAYKNLPRPKQDSPTATMLWHDNGLGIAFASLALILFGGISGWLISSQLINQRGPAFQTVSQLGLDSTSANKILLHINSMDEIRVRAALDAAEQLLRSGKSKANNKLELEIVANADGLGILRSNSPYSSRIKSLATQYKNVSFLACGIAKQNARLKEGTDIELIPEAQDIPAALDQILKRIEAGWTYVRG